MRKISHRSSGQFQSCARRLASAAGFALSALTTLAASHTWDGGGANDFWNDGLNWSLNVIPASGDNLRFAGAGPLVNSNNFAPGTRTFNSITFAAAGYDIRGTEVWTDAGGIGVTHGAGLTRVRAGVNLTVAQTIHVPNQFAIVSFDSFLHASSFPSCTISNAGTVEIADLFAEGNLSKRGSGLLTLKGSVNLDYLEITDGTVWANGSGGNFSLQPGGTLRGKGTISSVAAWSGGTVHPGDNGLGLLTSTGPVALGHALTTFRVVLNDDSAPGVGYDALWTPQLYLSNPFLDPGSEASNASLDVVLGRGFLPLVGQAFRIINVNNPNPIVGTFAGLPEGAVFTVSNVQFSITYTGFSGNDVTLQIVDVLPTGNTRVWDGGGVNNYWTNAANWVGDVAPTSGDSLVFPPGAARLLNTNSFPANIIFNSISLTGGGYTLRGNQIELLAGLHASQPSGGNTVALPLRLGADQSFTNSAPGGLTLSGAISLNGNDLTFQSSGGTLAVSGAINGLGSIEKRGSGNVTFSAGNGYFGLTRISEGRLTITHDNALGQSFAGTIVTNTGTLYLGGGVNVVEPLILASTGGGASGVLVNQENANEWTGDIALWVDTRMGVYGAAGELTLSGAINGPGGLLKTGSRRLNLTGPTANSYAGATTVLEGELRLGKTSGQVAIPGNLTIGDGVGGPDADVVMLVTDEQIADGASVTITASGLLAMTGFLSEQIGSLSGSGNFTCCNLSMPVFCVGDCLILMVGGNNASTTFSGTITHPTSAVVEKRGTGTWTLSGAAHGEMRVTQGTLKLASATLDGPVGVRGSGALTGAGTVLSHLDAEDDGVISPGTSAGAFAVGGLLQLKPNSVYAVELNGPNPGDYDQVIASNAQLTGGALDLHANFPATPGQQFVIITNTSALAVQGAFAGLPEGAVFSAGGQSFQITYQGGNGNDVVLTRFTGMFLAQGMNHALLGDASLALGANGELIVGNLGTSGSDGVMIPLHDADGWRGRLSVPSAPIFPPDLQIAWKIRATLNGMADQIANSARLEVHGDEVQCFAHSVSAGAAGYLIEVFRSGVLIESALQPASESLKFSTGISMSKPFVEWLAPSFNEPAWVGVFSWSEPQRVTLNAGSRLPTDADMVRITPLPGSSVPSNAPPFAIEVTGANVSEIQILDEALLYRPIVAKEGLPHRALGLAQMQVENNRFILSNLRASADGVSIQIGGTDTGIGVGIEPIDVQPAGTEVTLSAMGTLVGGRPSALGMAALASTGRQITMMANFDAVGSPGAMAEIFDGNALAGIALLTPGQTVMLGAGPSGVMPDLGAVGVVPPCLRPGFEATVQTALQPLPCYYFEFTEQATFTSTTGERLVGDRIRFVTQNGMGRFESLSLFDIHAALPGRTEAVIWREKLRFPAPEVTGVSRQRVAAGERFEIAGAGFGNDAKDISVMIGLNCLGLTPATILSASDTRLTAQIGAIPPDALGGPLQISRGVGVKVRPRLAFADVELLEDVLVFTHGGPPGKGTQLLQAAPSGPGSPTWFFSGPPVNGVLCLTVTNLWPSNALVRVLARLVDDTTGGGSYDVSVPAAQFSGSGSIMECGQRLADILRSALQQQAGVTPVISVTESGAGVKLTLALPAGSRIDCGFLAVCVNAMLPPPTILDVQPRTGREGDLVEIFGSGFGFDPDSLCLTIQDGGSGRLIPLRALMASDTYIQARVGNVPLDAQPGALMLQRGSGVSSRFQPASSNVALRAAAWVWHGQSRAIVGPRFTPVPTAPPAGPTWFQSAPPSNSVLGLVLNGNWPSNALVSVAVRAQDFTTGAGGFDLDMPALQILGGGTTVDCAQRIADLIRGAFQQQAGVEVGVRVDKLAGVSGVKLTIFLPNGGFIDRGFAAICVSPPPAAPTITDVQPRAGGEGDFITIKGSGFGTNPDDLQAYVEGSNGVRTFLNIVSAVETEIVAQVDVTPPGAQSGALIVTRGVGRRIYPRVPGVVVYNGVVDWQGTSPGGVWSDFQLNLATPANCSFSSDYPFACEAGRLCVLLDGTRLKKGAVVTVRWFFSNLDNNPGPSIATFSSDAFSPDGLSPSQNVAMLCDFLTKAMSGFFSGEEVACSFANLGMNMYRLTFNRPSLAPNPPPLYGYVNICVRELVYTGGVGLHTLGFSTLSLDAASHWQVSNLGVSGEDGVSFALGQSEGMLSSLTVPSNRVPAVLQFQTFGLKDGNEFLCARSTLNLRDGNLSILPDFRPAGAPSYQLTLLSGGEIVYRRSGVTGLAATIHDVGNAFQFGHVEGPWHGGGWRPDPSSPGVDGSVGQVGLWAFSSRKLVELADGQAFMADAVMTEQEALTSYLSVQPNVPSRQVILGEGLPGFTLQEAWLQKFGLAHQGLGEATLVAANGHLALTGLGPSGNDGLVTDFDALGQVIGLPPVKGYRVSLAPMMIGNGAEFRVGARGLFNGTAKTFLGRAGLRKPGANVEVFADFSPIGAAQVQVEIYRAGMRVGGVTAPGGGVVATVSSGGAGLPSLNGAGKLPLLPFCFTFTFDGDGTFVLPGGMRWLGDEIRLLASGATGVTERLSTFEITAAGFDGITLLNGTVLEEISLRVERVAGGLRLFWPAAPGGYLLDEAASLSGRSIPWMQVPASLYQTNSADIFVTVPPSPGNKFYRLHKP